MNNYIKLYLLINTIVIFIISLNIITLLLYRIWVSFRRPLSWLFFIVILGQGAKPLALGLGFRRGGPLALNHAVDANNSIGIPLSKVV
jgi:hypothetical protein